MLKYKLVDIYEIEYSKSRINAITYLGISYILENNSKKNDFIEELLNKEKVIYIKEIDVSKILKNDYSKINNYLCAVDKQIYNYKEKKLANFNEFKSLEEINYFIENSIKDSELYKGKNKTKEVKLKFIKNNNSGY